MKRIKIIEAGWDNYTAELCGVQFENGVSVTAVPSYQADRVGGIIKVVTFDEKGEGEVVGQANRMVGGVTISAPVVEGMRQPTPEEIEAERREVAAKAKSRPASVFYTREALEEIADQKGLKGLREIAAPWNVRDRSIPSLITEILAAQEKYMKRLEAAGYARPVMQGPDVVLVDEFGNPKSDPAPEAPSSENKE